MQQYNRPGDALPLHVGLEAMEDGFCMIDARGRITYWNAAAERAVGRGRERVLGRSPVEAFPFLAGARLMRQLADVATTRVARRFVAPQPVGLGRGFVSIYAAPLEDGGLVIHFRDATGEVKRAEEYSALLESIHDGFIAVDEQWQIVYLNAAAEQLLRFTRDRAVGLSIWAVLPRGPAEIAERLRATMADGIQGHLRDVRPEGRVFHGRVFDLWTYPLAGGGISVLFEDVSERVQREQDLARLAAEANEANQAKSRFFAAISHELRTPLNAIVGYTHLLSTETYGGMPEGATRAAERAGVCAEHLSRLVDDVLMMTTAELGRLPVNPITVALDRFLPGAVEALRHQATAKGLHFEIDLQEGLPPVETDPQRLRQLLNALLSNAVKYTRRGSVRIQVRLRTDPRPAGGCAVPPGARVEISVCDTGPGVADEHQERIFGPFEQVGDPARSNSMARGSGLGLSIARQLAGLLHGSLHLAETSEAGSRFCLLLPLVHSTPVR